MLKWLDIQKDFKCQNRYSQKISGGKYSHIVYMKSIKNQ